MPDRAANASVPTFRTTCEAKMFAGPETAARLGVPVGTVVEQREVEAKPGDAAPSLLARMLGARG